MVAAGPDLLYDSSMIFESRSSNVNQSNSPPYMNGRVVAMQSHLVIGEALGLVGGETPLEPKRLWQ